MFVGFFYAWLKYAVPNLPILYTMFNYNVASSKGYSDMCLNMLSELCPVSAIFTVVHSAGDYKVSGCNGLTYTYHGTLSLDVCKALCCQHELCNTFNYR